MASITIRMDDNLKRLAEGVFDSMGMNMTTAFTIFAKTAVRQGRIPFPVEADPVYSEQNVARLLKAKEDLAAGRNWHYHELIEDGNE